VSKHWSARGRFEIIGCVAKLFPSDNSYYRLFFYKLKPHYADLLEICCRLAGWPSLQQIYSKSTAFCHQRIVCNILLCRDVADKSVVSPASRQQIRSMWLRTDKSTASLQHAGDLLQTCCRQIRCVATKSAASRQQIASKSTANPYDVVWPLCVTSIILVGKMRLVRAANAIPQKKFLRWKPRLRPTQNFSRKFYLDQKRYAQKINQNNTFDLSEV
jgi:hypothetical protein